MSEPGSAFSKEGARGGVEAAGAPTERDARAIFSWKAVILIIVLAMLALGAWMYYRLETWPARTAREVSRAFAEIAQIQPRVTVHDRVFFEQTSPVLELAVVTRETTVEREMEHDWLGSKKRIRIRAVYRIRAGFDLQQPFGPFG